MTAHEPASATLAGDRRRSQPPIGRRPVPVTVPWAVLGAAGAVIRLAALEPPRTSQALAMVAVAVLWAVLLRVVAARIHGPARVGVVGLAGLVVIGVVGIWVGRDSLVVGLSGVLVLDACLPGLAPSLPWHRSRGWIAPLALLFLIVSQLEWVRAMPLPRVIGLLVIAYVLALLPDPRLPVGARHWVTSRRRRPASGSRNDASRRSLWIWAAIVVLGGSVAALWAPVIARLVADGEFRVLGINDYPLHVEVGGTFSLVPYVNNAPHFLFHAMTAGWHLLVGLEAAATLAICTSITLSFVAVVLLMHQAPRHPPRLPLGAAVATSLWFFLAESPGLYAMWWGLVPPTSPIYTLHWWGNPTWLSAVPFIVLTLPLVELAIADAEAGRRRSPTMVALAAVTVLGAVAKPALAIPLVPALPLYLLVVRRMRWRVALPVLLWCGLPAGVVVFWQTWFLDSSDASRFSSGFTVEFIVDAPFGWANVGWVFLFPFLLIAMAIGLAGWDYFKDRSVQLVLSCLVFALPLMLLVNETGERAVHGNFAVPAQGCMTLLILVSIRQIASQVLLAWRSRDEVRSRVVIAAVGSVAVVFLAGGALSLLDGTGAASVPIDWLDNI